ncbi:MAG: acyltransferase [Verrucomicrobiae bacterium]|nr:acyltransferase [Verrucomicrobiae bacterium]
MLTAQLRDLRSVGLRVAACLFLEEIFCPFLEALPFLIGSPFRWLFLKFTARRIGRQIFIAQRVSIRHAYNLEMGHHIGINQDSILHCRGGVSIGNHVFIGQRVIVNTGDHHYAAADRTIWEQGAFYRPVRIGNDVFLGMGAIIMPGVTVADGTVVAAGAVVTRDTDPYSVVAGVPAHAITRRGAASGSSAGSGN